MGARSNCVSSELSPSKCLRRCALLISLAAGACIAASTSFAQDAAAHFRGKTVNVLVGFGPGGGYDGYGQLLGQFIGKFIPGEPRVIVRHMPGAGSVTMLNHLYNVAAKDGLTFGIPAAGTAYTHLIGIERDKAAAKYDAQKFSWLGSLEAFTPIVFAWHKTRFRTMDDLRQHEFNYGSSGPTTGGETYAEMMNVLLGTKLKPVRGYKGSNEIALAIERGELDGIVGWCWTCVKADKPQYIAEKTGIFIAQFGVTPERRKQYAQPMVEIFSWMFGALAARSSDAFTFPTVQRLRRGNTPDCLSPCVQRGMKYGRRSTSTQPSIR